MMGTGVWVGVKVGLMVGEKVNVKVSVGVELTVGEKVQVFPGYPQGVRVAVWVSVTLTMIVTGAGAVRLSVFPQARGSRSTGTRASR
jgi:hypothetical protein